MSVAPFAGQRSLLHPDKLGKRAGQLLALARDLPGHWRYAYRIRRAAQLGLTTDDGLLRYKYLGSYLTNAFGRRQRRQAILSHYDVLAMLTKGSSATRRFAQRTILWELASADPGETLRIGLQPSKLAPMEGELELQFTLGARVLATLTFLFARGTAVDVQAGTVCIIGGLQGGLDCRAEIRRAAKLNGEIAPSAMLLTALKALADAFAVDQMLGVSSRDQIASHYAQDRMCVSYDRMWAHAGASGRASSFYILVPEGDERPLTDVPAAHRRRTRRKRERKLGLRCAIQARAHALLTSPAYAAAH